MPFVGQLHAFQKEAVDRMIERERLLVAYEMGLGKTVISIAAIEELFESGEVNVGFVVAPSSLKYQWFRQIGKFTGGEAKPIVIDGTPKKRREQYAAVRRGEHDYVIVNYEQIVNDWAEIARLPYDFVVLDEATAIKTSTSKRTKQIRKLQPRFRFALSGQPVENRPEELFNIMRWVDADVLGRFDLFDKTFIVRNRFGAVLYYRNLKTLNRVVSEAMVRKARADVADELPSVVEETQHIDFDSTGARLYRRISRDLLTDLAQAMNSFGDFDVWAHYHGGGAVTEADRLRGAIMSKLTCLRMLCDHPELLRISAKRFKDGEAQGTAGGSAYAAELKAKGLLDASFKTPKFDATVELIEEILAANPDNKVVLFSFFKPTLTFLQSRLKKHRPVQFHGGMSAKAKDTAKTIFETDPRCRVFLSSDAGGYGVDLPNANYLISYDLPWSAGKLDQRNARIIRLSSEWDSVTLITMLMRGSVEERQYDMLTQKRRIASAIIDGEGIDQKGRLTLSLASLKTFLSGSSV